MIDLQTIENKIINGYLISQNEALEIIETIPTKQICDAANRIRQHFMGNHIDTCSIMNARSGRCSEDCKWCSQSSHHTSKVDIYPLVSVEAALKDALTHHSQGIKRFSLVTSGRTMTDKEISKAVDIYHAIAERCNIHLCASMGLLGKEQLTQLKNCGVEHYHCNMETAPSFFGSLCTTHTSQEKIQTITWAKEVGLKICSGGIIGMGESMAQRVELATTLRELGAVSIPMNILNPIPGTKLEHAAPMSDDEILQTFAIFRLVNPKAQIRFAGGRSRITAIQDRALLSGVSAALMGDLLTTTGADTASDKALFARLGFQM